MNSDQLPSSTPPYYQKNNVEEVTFKDVVVKCRDFWRLVKQKKFFIFKAVGVITTLVIISYFLLFFLEGTHYNSSVTFSIKTKILNENNVLVDSFISYDFMNQINSHPDILNRTLKYKNNIKDKTDCLANHLIDMYEEDEILQYELEINNLQGERVNCESPSISGSKEGILFQSIRNLLFGINTKDQLGMSDEIEPLLSFELDSLTYNGSIVNRIVFKSKEASLSKSFMDQLYVYIESNYVQTYLENIGRSIKLLKTSEELTKEKLKVIENEVEKSTKTLQEERIRVSNLIFSSATPVEPDYFIDANVVRTARLALAKKEASYQYINELTEKIEKFQILKDFHNIEFKVWNKTDNPVRMSPFSIYSLKNNGFFTNVILTLVLSLLFTLAYLFIKDLVNQTLGDL